MHFTEEMFIRLHFTVPFVQWAVCDSHDEIFIQARRTTFECVSADELEEESGFFQCNV